MFDFMLRLFVKDHENVSDPLVRSRYGLLSGITGIICNMLLFVLKLTVGGMIGSVAVISDAFNNLSDMGSTVISVVGIRLANRKPDRDHPFGHGRFEYVSALIVSFIIMLVGVELFKTSFDKIIHPTQAESVNWLMIALLSVSLPIKLFMYGYNSFFGKKISSETLHATALDSRNDCIATGAVILSAMIDGLHVLPFVIDGYAGAAVSLLIMYAGFGVAKDTVGLLLGKAPDKETVMLIRQKLSETPEIIDIHDLIIHDYGPGRLFASVHAEISDTADIVAAHEAIDAAEQAIFRETGCELTIHMDPVSTDNPLLENVKNCIHETLEKQNGSMKFHDLRMTDGVNSINIIFDVVMPFEVSDECAAETVKMLKENIAALDARYRCVIQIDRDFVNFL